MCLLQLCVCGARMWRPLCFHVDTSERLHCAGAIRGAQNDPIQSKSASRQRERSVAGQEKQPVVSE